MNGVVLPLKLTGSENVAVITAPVAGTVVPPVVWQPLGFVPVSEPASTEPLEDDELLEDEELPPEDDELLEDEELPPEDDELLEDAGGSSEEHALTTAPSAIANTPTARHERFMKPSPRKTADREEQSAGC